MKENENKTQIFIVLLVASIIGSLIHTSLTVALPSIMRDFQVSAATGQWLTSAYSLVVAIMVPATAYLIHRFPLKRLFLSSMLIFTAGLLIDGFSGSFPVLLFGRMLQAIGNGIILSLTQVVILTIFPIEKRGSMMGLYGLATAAAPILSPTVAGIIIDSLGWNSIFLGCALFSILDIFFAVKVLKNVLQTEKQRFDSLSMVLCSVGFSALLLGLGNLGIKTFFSFHVFVPLVIGTLSLVLFVKRQLRQEEPFLNLRIFSNNEFRSAVIIAMVMYVIMMAGTTLIPIYIQTLRGFSATVSGLVTMPGSLILAVINPFAGRIYDRFGIQKLVVCGSGILLLSSVSISFLRVDTSLIYISLMYILRLIAIGLLMMPITTWGLSTIKTNSIAHGTALITSLRTIAGSIGSAVFVSIMIVASQHFTGESSVLRDIHGMNIAFMILSILALVEFILSIGLTMKKKHKSDPQSIQG
ncbi:MAG: multidrug efflux MFS transporter [Chloroflexi bacterium]|nr:multidrug efflux MFS transporter [Chloroflexota bacterium]